MPASSARRAIAADQPAELELDQEHAGELGPASDRRRPAAEIELDHEDACELGRATSMPPT